MNHFRTRFSWIALAAAGTALITITGTAATAAQAVSTTVKAKPVKGCPLTDPEKAGDTLDLAAPFDYPSTLYTAPGSRIELWGSGFDLRPIGTLTVATKANPRTIVKFCADKDGVLHPLQFPADVVSGPATVTMASRDGKKVMRQTFTIVALPAMPAKPGYVTDIVATTDSQGITLTWKSTSAMPEAEYYRVSCAIKATAQTKAFIPWDMTWLGNRGNGVFALDIQAQNPAGFTQTSVGWQLNPDRTLTRLW